MIITKRQIWLTQRVQRREQRKTQTGAGTAAQVVESLEMVAASAIEMYKKNGADGLTVTDAHALLVNDVALKQGMMAISSKARSNYPQYVSWLATFATFVQCFYPSCGWRHNLPLDGSGGKPIAIPAISWWCFIWRWLPTAWCRWAGLCATSRTGRRRVLHEG